MELSAFRSESSEFSELVKYEVTVFLRINVLDGVLNHCYRYRNFNQQLHLCYFQQNRNKIMVFLSIKLLQCDHLTILFDIIRKIQRDFIEIYKINIIRSDRKK